MIEIPNPLYGSVCLLDEQPLKKQFKSLQNIFKSVFEKIADYSESDIINATHQARKTLKSYRAFVKLLKDCSEVKNDKEANYLLRDLGKEFSAMRDSHVREMLLTELNRSLQSTLLQELIEKNDLEKERKEKTLLHNPNHFDQLYKTVKQSSLLNELLNQSEIQQSCIVDSLKTAFKKSESAYSECSDLETEEAFHEWRKRLKDLLNQLKLFRSEQYLLSDGRFIHINELCEEMGLLNDMSMLKVWVKETGSRQEKDSDYNGIIKFLDKKISVFQKRILEAGNQFYETPDATFHDLESMIFHE